MKVEEAIALIRNGVTGDGPQRWADLGCGGGTFTFALQSLLATGSRITAIDKQKQVLPVDFIKADFEKDDLNLRGLDGILLANSLHYVRDKTRLIKKLENYFAAKPAFLIVEYDTSRSNLWVPYPISYQNLRQLFTCLGYSSVNLLAEVSSRFGGRMYAALVRL
jgi:ubiquinone/menaquinone biosynthesis C-methylase UbiE